MKRALLLSCMLALLAGCASGGTVPARPVGGDVGSPQNMADKPAAKGELPFTCKIPCSVLPGPECC